MLTGRPRHDQIRDLYASQLASVWREDSTETTSASFDKKIDSFVKGELEHAAAMLSTFWEVINKPDDITFLSNPPPAESVPALPSLVLQGCSLHPTGQIAQ